MRMLDGVVGGRNIEEFTDTTVTGDQFALF